MEFSVLLVDVFPYDIFLRGNIQTDFIIRDTGGKSIDKKVKTSLRNILHKNVVVGHRMCTFDDLLS